MKPLFNKQRIPLFTKLLTTTFILLIGYAVVAHIILIPHAIADNYDQQLKPDFKLLRSQFNALSKSTELPVYNDPYADLQKSQTDLLATQKLIAETEQTLASYTKVANMLQGTALAPYSLSFKKAEVTRTRSEDIFLQSHEVINDYKAWTNYLLQVNTARMVFKNSTSEINGLTNLNILLGQGDIVAARANQLRDTIKTIQKITPPAEFTEYHTAIIVSFQQALAGLDQISRGVYTTNDAQINAGALTLQQAIQKYESGDSLLFDTASSTSPVLAEAATLADKADSLRPFSEQ